MAFGWSFGRWQVMATLMAHDVITTNGGRDDNLMMPGVDVRHHRELVPHLDLSLRAGGFHAGIWGPDAGTPLEQYRGGGVRAGVGLRFRTFSMGGATFCLTAEVIRNEMWLRSEGAKDLRGHTHHVLVGIEVVQSAYLGRRPIW